MSKRLKDLNKRLVVSLGILFVVALLIAFSSSLFVGILIVILVSALAAVGVWEYANLLKSKSLELPIRLLIPLSALQITAFFLAHKFGFSLLPIMTLCFFLAMLFLSHFKNLENALLNIAVEFFSLLYIAMPLGFMIGILYPISEGVAQSMGQRWLIYLVLVTKVTDIGAYFVGKLWGKKKLAPLVSPQKTIEGALSGLLCATLTSVLFAFLGVIPLTISGALILGVVMGIFAQIGDLSESLLKRDALVKDSNMLPGIGGVLDLIDSLIFTAPIIYFTLNHFYS